MGFQQINWDGLAWARKQLDNERTGPAPKSAGEMLARGDVIYIYTDGKHAAQLVQMPEAQAALVSLDPTDGSVAALVGGFDYFTQQIQPRGAGEAPAGLLVQTLPVLLGAGEWLHRGLGAAGCPDRDRGQRHGDRVAPEELARRHSTARRACAKPSRNRCNLVSIRLLRQLGIDYAINYVTRFGFDKASLPNNFTLALGTMQIAPIDLAGAYATFANGGFRVSPYYIDRIEDLSGKVLWAAESHPSPACRASRPRI